MTDAPTKPGFLRVFIHGPGAFVLPLIYMALIFAISSMSHVSIPSNFPFRDKGIHFCEYLVLGWLCTHAVRAGWPTRPAARTLLLGAFVATMWGLGDEIHQAFVPNRSADPYDLLADALGSISGAALRLWLERPLRFLSPPPRPTRVSSPPNAS